MHEIVIAVVRSRSVPVPVPFSSLLFLVTAEAVTPRDAANAMAVYSLLSSSSSSLFSSLNSGKLRRKNVTNEREAEISYTTKEKTV